MSSRGSIIISWKPAGGSSEDDQKTVLKKIFRQTLEKTREKKGIFGVNVMVAVEMKDWAELIIDTMIELREQDPEMKERFKILVTSAGDPLPWTPKVKKAGLLWMHVIPSVKGALRCQKAGVDAVVASGAQMGTRFLATQESDFHPMWKEGVVKAGDRGTLVARGFVGPARFLKTPVSLKHQENTLKMSPGVFLGKPDDYSTVPMELINSEIAAMNAVYAGDETKALLAGGECAQRIQDLPTVEDLVKRIVREAEEVLAKMPGRLA
ncbi:MAG: hypothetical protein EHM27_16620 [Deltaproteobacteria bacterium]|nr:MAG: hypothetical protein EHM27_16620 [Deltaproteobacteria bacterium]